MAGPAASRDLVMGLAARAPAALALLWLVSCSSVPPAPEDPLVEQILESATGERIAPEELFDRMAQADVIYLGELHDHPDHHRHQVEVIDALLARGLQPAIGFERFAREETSHLMSFSKGSAHHSASEEAANALLRDRLGWESEDDPYWTFYAPKFARMREHGLVAFGADLPAALRSRLAAVALDELSGVERSLLVPSDLVDEAYRGLMYEQFRAGHCGWGSEPYLRRLYDAWLARNEAMADAIVAALESGVRPVVFLTGNAHVQYGMGVPERVAHRRPGVAQVQVGMRVVAPEPMAVAHYLAPTRFEERDFGADFQYLWLTARHQPLQPDPCAVFRKRESEKGSDAAAATDN